METDTVGSTARMPLGILEVDDGTGVVVVTSDRKLVPAFERVECPRFGDALHHRHIPEVRVRLGPVQFEQIRFRVNLKHDGVEACPKDDVEVYRLRRNGTVFDKGLHVLCMQGTLAKLTADVFTLPVVKRLIHSDQFFRSRL